MVTEAVLCCGVVLCCCAVLCCVLLGAFYLPSTILTLTEAAVVVIPNVIMLEGINKQSCTQVCAGHSVSTYTTYHHMCLLRSPCCVLISSLLCLLITDTSNLRHPNRSGCACLHLLVLHLRIHHPLPMSSPPPLRLFMGRSSPRSCRLLLLQVIHMWRDIT